MDRLNLTMTWRYSQEITKVIKQFLLRGTQTSVPNCVAIVPIVVEIF